MEPTDSIPIAPAGARLTQLLFILIRDHIPVGVLASTINEHVKGLDPFSYSNDDLARVAAKMALSVLVDE